MKDETKRSPPRSKRSPPDRTGQGTDAIIQFLIVVYSVHAVRSLQKQEEHDSALKNSDCDKFGLCLGSSPPPWLFESYSVAQNVSVSIFGWRR